MIFFDRGIAARVANHPRLTYLVIKAFVGVAMNPQARLVFQFLVKYPLQPPILDMDVAGQDNNVGADNGRREIAELNM